MRFPGVIGGACIRWVSEQQGSLEERHTQRRRKLQPQSGQCLGQPQFPQLLLGGSMLREFLQAVLAPSRPQHSHLHRLTQLPCFLVQEARVLTMFLRRDSGLVTFGSLGLIVKILDNRYMQESTHNGWRQSLTCEYLHCPIQNPSCLLTGR